METIILRGSMKVKDKILEIKEILENNNFKVLLPEECLRGVNKNEASRAHFNRIISNNAYVLIVNEEKKE